MVLEPESLIISSTVKSERSVEEFLFFCQIEADSDFLVLTEARFRANGNIVNPKAATPDQGKAYQMDIYIRRGNPSEKKKKKIYTYV